MNPNDVVPFVLTLSLLGMVGAVLILRGPVGRALGRRIEGKSSESGDLEIRVQELERRLEQQDADRLQLEERLDFTERMLSQVQEGPKELKR